MGKTQRKEIKSMSEDKKKGSDALESKSLPKTTLQKIIESGWSIVKPGVFRKGRNKVITKYNDYVILKRVKPISEGEKSVKNGAPTCANQKCARQPIQQKSVIPTEIDGGQNPPIWDACIDNLTPTPCDPALPVKFESLPSVIAVRESLKPTLNIGIDTEFQNLSGSGLSKSPSRYIISYQFCILDPESESQLEYVFLNWKALSRADADFIKALVRNVEVGELWKTTEVWKPTPDVEMDRRISLRYALALIFGDLHLPCFYERDCYQCSAIVKVTRSGKPVYKSFKEDKDAQAAAAFEYVSEWKLPCELKPVTSKTHAHQKFNPKEEDYKFMSENAIDVTIVFHAGSVDLSAFSDWRDFAIGRGKFPISEINKGLVTLEPQAFWLIDTTRENLVPKNKYYNKVYICRLSFRDTLCHAADSQRSLKALGDMCGVPKIELPAGRIENMQNLLRDDPILFMNYAANDPAICLHYFRRFYEMGKKAPVTVTSGGATLAKRMISGYLGCLNNSDFMMFFQGLKSVGKGVYTKDDVEYIQYTNLEPLNEGSRLVQAYASSAYHGGYNASFKIGFYTMPTFDYDLQSAYPTAMSLVPDVDWCDPILIEDLGHGRELDLQFWRIYSSIYDPSRLIFASVTEFEFPESVKFPCLPLKIDGIPVYPRKFNSKDRYDGDVPYGEAYFAGPELYLALKLGAKIKYEKLLVLKELMRGNDEPSFSVREVLKQLVSDRRSAKITYGNKSPEELLLKLFANGLYGKTAQNVVPKHTWTAASQTASWDYKVGTKGRTESGFEPTGPSSVTNPVYAAMTTSICSATLCAAANELHDKYNFNFYSATTDGFISDAPIETVKALDLYGLTTILRHSREILAGAGGGSVDIWEVKHHQDEFLNFTTRGNVAMNKDGVCAHNSFKTPYPKGSEDDRKHLFKTVISRTDRVPYTVTEFIPYRKMLEQNRDFTTTEKTTTISMDFDLKRKPMLDDAYSIMVANPYDPSDEYEVLNFDTQPFEDLGECLKYRITAANHKSLKLCLRTQADWEAFLARIHKAADARRLTKARRIVTKKTDPDKTAWEIIRSCVALHRIKGDDPQFKIPFLDLDISVREKIDIINSFNDSSKKFTVTHWKNCRRADRLDSCLPLAIISDKLAQMQEYKN